MPAAITRRLLLRALPALPAAVTAAPATAPDRHPLAQRLWRLIDEIGDWPEPDRLAPVHQFFNRHLAFRDDALVWGVDDHWASPLEALARGAGDCEDYAIGKYCSLLAAGVPMRHLRLVYGRVRQRSGRTLPHLLLVHRPDGAAPRVLDNLVAAIEPLARRADFTAQFSFHGEALWEGFDGAPAGDPLRRVPPWPGVLARARAEGFPT